MDGKLLISIQEYSKVCHEKYVLKVERDLLKKEYESLKEDYKLLTDEITVLYNLMNGINITNKYENNSEIEEL